MADRRLSLAGWHFCSQFYRPGYTSSCDLLINLSAGLARFVYLTFTPFYIPSPSRDHQALSNLKMVMDIHRRRASSSVRLSEQATALRFKSSETSASLRTRCQKIQLTILLLTQKCVSQFPWTGLTTPILPINIDTKTWLSSTTSCDTYWIAFQQPQVTFSEEAIRTTEAQSHSTIACHAPHRHP